MKQWKRLLSLVLAASLVFSMGIVLPEVKADSSSAPTETTWDFSSADGWTLEDGFTVKDGKLVWQSGLSASAGSHGTPYGLYYGNKAVVSDAAAVSWTNYAVSADITATYNGSTHAGNGSALNQFSYGGISFFVSATDWVQVRVQPGNMMNQYMLRVYENSTSNNPVNEVVYVGTDTSTEKTVRAYNLKVELFSDGKMVIYINEQKVKEITVSLPAGGAPALMAWPASTSATTQDTVTFDNAKVTSLAAPVVAPTPDFGGTLLGWSDGSAALGSDWTVSGTYAAENGVLKATTADDFSAKVGSAVQHGYIEADVTLPAKSAFTATSNKNLGYINATVGTNQVYTLRLFWQQTSQSTTLHDGKLYADLYIDDSVNGTTAGANYHNYGGAAQGTRVSFNLSDEHWGKTYTLRLTRIGNFVEAKLVDKATQTVLKLWQYALNPAYSITTGKMTFGFGSALKDSGCAVTFDNVVAASINANAVSAGELEMAVDAYEEIGYGLDDAAQKVDSFYRTAYAPGEVVTVTLKSADAWDLGSLKFTTATNTAGTKLVATEDPLVYTFVMPAEAVTLVGNEKETVLKDFAWDFADGILPEEFPARDAFSIVDGKLVWHSKETTAAATQYSGEGVFSTNAENVALWNDYTASVDVKVNKSAYEVNHGYPMVGLAVAYTAAGNIQLRARPTGAANEYNIEVRQIVGATNTALYSQLSAKVDGDATIAADGSVEFTLAITLHEGVVTAYIDGDEVFTTTTELTNTAGAVGVLGFATAGTSTALEIVEFDNLKVDFPEGPLDYNATLVDRNDGSADLDADLWTKTGAAELTVENGALFANSAIYYKTTQTYTHGFIEADITLTEGAMADMTANGSRNGANLAARWIGTDDSEVRARFLVTKTVNAGAEPTYTAVLELVVYSTADYGIGAPQRHAYTIPNFAWGNTYNVRLVVLGNMFKIVLDGEDILTYCAPADTAIASYAEGSFGLAHRDDSFGVAYDNLVIAAAEPQTVQFDSNISATLPECLKVGTKTLKVARTHFAPGEIVTVTLTDSSLLDLSTLRYTTATNAAGVLLTATAEENVYTFVMPEEAVTVTCGEVIESAGEVIYSNDGSQSITGDLWSDAMQSNGTGIITSNKSYINTAVSDGWIKADFTLPALTTGDLQTATINPFYGVRVMETDGSGTIEADIWYDRNRKQTKLRLYIRGTDYANAALEDIDLGSYNLWGKTVTMELRKVGNYIEMHAACAEANLDITRGFTFASNKDVGSVTNRFRFGINHDKAAFSNGADGTGVITNIEIGRINKLVCVTVDVEAADKVSLPVTKEAGTSTVLDRTGYQVGEVLALTLTNASDAANLKYTTATNTEGVAITNAAAFAVPNEDAITLVCAAPVDPETPQPSTEVATADGSAALDANIWAITGAPVVENGVITSAAGNTVVLTKLPYRHASIVAEITLPATHSLTANTTVAAVVARINPSQEHVARFQYSANGSNLQLGMLVRDEVNISNSTDNPHYGGGAHGVSRGNNHNEAWGKTYIVEVVRIGNLIQVTFTDKETTAVVESWTYNLKPAYEVTTTPMYFGFTTGMAGVVIDNVVVTSYDAHTVSAGELSATLDDAAEIAPGLDSSGLEYFSRTHYAAGETVSVMLNDTTDLDLTTLRYVTATNTAGVALTATAIPGIYTFVMPQEDVTLLCDEIVITEPSEVIATVDGEANLNADLWTVTGAYAADGTIRTTAGDFKAVLSGAYQDFSMVADITLPAKPADLSANINLANLVATVGSGQVYTARFFWQSSNTTFSYDLYLDDSVNGLGTGNNKHNYGSAGQGTRIWTALNDSHWGKTYTVTLSRIGNYLYTGVVDKETGAEVVKKMYNLNPDYSVTKGAVSLSFGADGSKGEVAFDNVTVTSYNVRTISKGELDVSLDSMKEIAPGLETGAVIDTFERTAYAAGETVTVVVNDPSQLDLSTIRYISASNPEGVKLTATGDPTVFTFQMPNENVTLVCDEGEGIPIVPKPEGEVYKQNFDALADGTDVRSALMGLSVTDGANNATVNSGALKLNGLFGAITTTTHQHGYIQADICLESALSDLENATETVTKYGGNLSAKWDGGNGTNEVRTRFMIVRTPGAVQEYTVELQMIIYSRSDYGWYPVTHSYDMSSVFAWGNTYNVKLVVIGNFIQVYLDGAVVMSYAVEEDAALAAYAGKFGIGHTDNSFVVTMDNVQMHEYKAYAVSFDANTEGILKTDVYTVYKTSALAMRTHFREGELVRLNVNAPTGFGVDEATIKYTGETCGEVAITGKESAQLYGFKMPAEDVVVSTGLTAVVAETKPVSDNFDLESLMRDRGWSNEKQILDGGARLYGSTETYLVGVAGSESWNSFTASAKVTYFGSTSSSTGVAALCTKTSGASKGYELALCVDAGAKNAYLRLYDRTNGKILYMDEKHTLEIGRAYELKLVINGNRLTGYLDGQWKFTVTVDQAVGGIGVRTLVANAAFDDIKVTDIVAK